MYIYYVVHFLNTFVREILRRESSLKFIFNTHDTEFLNLAASSRRNRHHLLTSESLQRKLPYPNGPILSKAERTMIEAGETGFFLGNDTRGR